VAAGRGQHPQVELEIHRVVIGRRRIVVDGGGVESFVEQAGGIFVGVE